MLEYVKHLLGICGENHGFLYMFFIFGSAIFTIIKITFYNFKWWIKDNLF